jgi:hypothetical protein
VHCTILSGRGASASGGATTVGGWPSNRLVASARNAGSMLDEPSEKLDGLIERLLLLQLLLIETS